MPHVDKIGTENTRPQLDHNRHERMTPFEGLASGLNRSPIGFFKRKKRQKERPRKRAFLRGFPLFPLRFKIGKPSCPSH
jgi:hypothetical protein